MKSFCCSKCFAKCSCFILKGWYDKKLLNAVDLSLICDLHIFFNEKPGKHSRGVVKQYLSSDKKVAGHRSMKDLKLGSSFRRETQ